MTLSTLLKEKRKQDYIERVETKCSHIGCEFVRIVGEYTNMNSRIVLKCCKPDHGDTWEASISGFLRGYGGCQKCNHISLENYNKRYTKFVQAIENLEGNKHKFDYKKEDSDKWSYKCKVCSFDDLVSDGLCTGRFKTSGQSLKKCAVTCRCDTRVHVPKEQYEHKLKKICEKDTNYTFVGWVDKYKNGISTMKMLCKKHGPFEVGARTFILYRGGCAQCSSSRYDRKKDGVLYVMKIFSRYDEFTGYGISTNFDQRLTTHKRKLKEKGYWIEEMEVFNLNAGLAKDIESKLTFSFDRTPKDVQGFAREATHIYNYLDVIEFVEKEMENGSNHI